MNLLGLFTSRNGTVQYWALRIGLGSLVVSLTGAVFNPAQFFSSYLLSYMFWLGLAVGCLALLMLHHLVGGRWGVLIRRLLEAGTRTLPVLAVLFVPVVFGLSELYSWTRPAVVADDALLQHKSVYLNVPFFLARTLLYFAVWLGLAFFCNTWSRAQDDTRSATARSTLTARLERLSGPGLVLYGATVTFATIDWLMSLDPHWYSTIYGAQVMVGQVLGSLAFVLVVLGLLADRKPFVTAVTAQHLHDLGNLLLAFVMLWAYLAFSQYLIIWSGNLPEETHWYLHRQTGGWQWVSLSLIVLHFAVPFFILLSRTTKRSMTMLSRTAGFLLAMRLVECVWLIKPSLPSSPVPFSWLDMVTPIGVGGVWIAAFAGQLAAWPLLPRHARTVNQDPLPPEGASV